MPRPPPAVAGHSRIGGPSAFGDPDRKHKPSSHASLASRPVEVAALILEAAAAVLVK
ncbi:hypothetical protein [Janthinobacterium sp. FW305-128]|uniref:hypothetical protein n=1 Tax=Janthinobacterium sp. FW305-128 TaxID=2775055 RepID=UPI001E2F0146|nr:hypothetical protein [Janthinobacterium sp. FW305-128]MCC7683424.1 hypothetical protein [Janthinobacterium sp. FW305-128]